MVNPICFVCFVIGQQQHVEGTMNGTKTQLRMTTAEQIDDLVYEVFIKLRNGLKYSFGETL